MCGCGKYTLLFRDHNRRDNINCSGTYVQCKGCSLVYLQDRPPWKEIVKFYSSMDEDQTANAGELRRLAEASVSKWKQLLRKIRFRPHSWPLEFVPQGTKKLLDLGCGSGAKLFEFVRRGYEVWGVDVGEDTIRLCKELLPEGHFIQGELQDTDLPDGYFDYIRIDNALEHVPNPKEVIVECRRLLRGGGQLMVYVPHGRSISMRFMKGNSISAWIPFHLQLFTRKSLRRLLEDAGFNPQISQISRINPIRIYYYNPTSWLPLSIMQWKNQKQPAMKFNHHRWLAVACYPIGWLAAKFGMGEELVGIGLK
jgi:SAM-dependent methyltransferase